MSNIYQIGKATFKPDLNQLITTEVHTLNNSTQLLLLLFIENKGAVVTRDEISSYCWKNRYVSDDSIRQLITKLRKLLVQGDDSIAITTVRGKGYRLNLAFKLIDDTDIAETEVAQKHQYFTLYALATLFIFITGLYIINATPSKFKISDQVFKKITFEKGSEIDVRVRDDYYAYIKLNSDQPTGKTLLVKNSKGDTLNSFTPSNINGHVFTPAIHPSKDLLAYLDYATDDCHIMIVNLITSELISSIQCYNSDARVALDWIDDNTLLFSSSNDITKPLALQSYNIKTGRYKGISNPKPNGRGDFFARTCEGSVALLRNRNWKDNEIHIDHELSNYETYLLEHKGNPIVLDWYDCDNLFYGTDKGELYNYNLQSNENTLISDKLVFETTLEIDQDTKHIYLSGEIIKDLNVFSLDLVTGITQNELTSTGSDSHITPYLNDSIVFISNKTGSDQLWLRQHNGVMSQLTELSDNIYIKGVLTIPDNKNIFYSSKNSVFSYNPDTQSSTLIFSSDEIITDFTNYKKGFLFTQFNHNRWELLYFDGTSYNLFNNHGIKSLASDSKGKVYLGDEDNQIFTIKYDKLEMVSQLKGMTDWTVSNNDDSHLYFITMHSVLKLNLKTLDIKTISNYDLPLNGNISVINKKMYLMKNESPEIDIKRYTLFKS